ncbi:MAG: PepSY-associated TM helix domain-containing protein [Pigmentiphaga sp.]|uniref:PepSY-associated TM helix domain-containing protein n=1 Tax=Pigmentiphaga sp. TaxID=1977564 RepID=UPI00299FB2EC|nr:PepSY-associated TM helix domain-containing protein [Pigmentiphaga sp.]MDX3906715.1 PepSY-associated TM helix domain-containing protein [Pigmentiphaga sp.]
MRIRSRTAPRSRSPRTLVGWHWVHRWSSLVCTLFLLMLCLTGLPLIFGHEIDHALGAGFDLPAVADPAARAPLDDVLADASARRPGYQVRFLTADDEEPVLFISLTPAGTKAGGALFTYDARTGELVHEGALRSLAMRLLAKLHTDMFAGLPGSLVLAAMGVLFAVSVVSGVAVYAPILSRVPFGTVRRGRSARIKWLDLHNLVGMVALLWMLLVGLTGVLLALSKPVYGLWQATELAAMTAPWRSLGPAPPQASVDQAVAVAREQAPGRQLAFVAFPGTPLAGPRHYAVFMRGDGMFASRLITPVLVDAQTGAFAAKRDMPAYVAALRISGPLHYGDFAGWPLKLAWALFTLATLVVLGSGLFLWVRRPPSALSARPAAEMD